MKSYSVVSIILAGMSVLATPVARAAATTYTDLGNFASPGNVEQMLYSSEYKRLILRNSGSAVRVVDLTTGAISSPFLANYSFNDIDLTPDGRYVFAADYGGENIGYSTPSNIHYVHRLDLLTGTWETKKTPAIAGHVEAISGDRFVLSSLDQWTTFTMNEWGTTNVAPIVSTSSYGGSTGYFSTSAYAGDIEYDSSTGRILHGNSGLSSQEVAAYRINGNDFFAQESTGTYGTAQGYGGSVVLSQDQQSLYYGALKVEALDVTNTLQVFPEAIFAATGDVAFGSRFYYDAVTGLPIDDLGFSTQVYAIGDSGPEL
ncbi:MAG: hypothetical protein GC151_12350 [Betaproteobacteria bacterium]|nr:hypothetical protein [Betaproteobacteria bacterium]